MALDRNALLAKLQNLQKKPVDNTQFKPEEGEQLIRIVPLKSDPSNPFIQVYFHFNKKGKTYVSPLTFGEADPWQEFSDALIGNGGLSKEDYKAAKDFCPTLRTYVPVVVRGKESEGVKFWAFGKQIYEQLLKLMTDEDYGDITDVKTGRDIKVTFTPKEKSTKTPQFAETEIMVKPNQSPLSKDDDIMSKLLNEQPDLFATLKRSTYAELETALHEFVNGVAPETTGTTIGSTENSEEAPAPVKKGKLSEQAQKEFEDVFGD